jgi:hypothetical protein
MLPMARLLSVQSREEFGISRLRRQLFKGYTIWCVRKRRLNLWTTSAEGRKQACPVPAFEVRFTFNSGICDPQLPDYLSVGFMSRRLNF